MKHKLVSRLGKSILAGSTAQWGSVCALIVALYPRLSVGMQVTAPDKPVVHIGIVVDGPWRFGDDPRAIFEREMIDLLSGTYDVRFEPRHNAEGDWTQEGVAQAFDRLLADPDVELIIAGGLMASLYAADRARSDTLPVPVIAPVVLDPDLQGLHSRGGSSGLSNFNYLGFPNTISRDLRKFREIVHFERLTILVPRSVRIPEFPDRVSLTPAGEDVAIDVVSVGDSAQEALDQFGPEVQAVYLFPLPQLSKEEVALLAEGLIELKIPSFSFFGGEYVEMGILAALNTDVFQRLARRVALNAFDILQGT
ncbi:MAG TPA: hypothetical protein VIL33_06035, partial [Rhodothermia bacterium]